MKIVFAGSPQFAVPTLEKLAGLGEVVAVITQPDRPKGRGNSLTPTAVKVCAEKLGLPVYEFEKIRDNAPIVKSLGADIMITCAFGQILTQEILDIFPQGVWNIHASLLPKYRGASPVQAAILGGDEYTGITVMKTERELDAGGILLVKRCKTEDLTCGALTEKLSYLGADAAAEAVELVRAGEPQLLIQDEAKVTFCKKISKSDAHINFGETSGDICRLIRAFSPKPAAFCNLNGAALNVLYAMEEECDSAAKFGEVISADKRGILVKCKDGAVRLTLLQPAGGKIMNAADFVNGRKIKVGDVLD